MVKSIIKRIIVGVGIALVLMAIKGNLLIGANAQTIGSYAIGGTTAVVDNTSSGYSISVSGSPWANYGDGYLFINFSLYKVSGASTGANVGVRTIKVFSGQSSYVCYFGSNTVENSTFTNSSYSAMCPVYLGSSGVTSIWIGLQDNQQNSLSNYRLTADSIITFDQKPITPNNDYSGSLGTINGNIGALGDYIVNGDQSIVDSQQETTQAIEDTNNTIKDDTAPSDTDIGDLFDIETNDSNSPVSDLITMPITLLQAYLNGFSASCSAFDLGTLYGHNLSIPCIQPQRYLGSGLWNLIDICISLFLAYNVGLMCISIYESITSLDDNFQTLYTPRHAQSEYKPKHGGSD